MPKRLIPRLSLHARLLTVAALTSIAALLFAAFTISHVLERFVMRGLDASLDTQIGILADAVSVDGKLDQAQVISLPGFRHPERGWTWRVHTTRGEWTSNGLALTTIRVGPERPHRRTGVRPGEGRVDGTVPVHLRQLSYASPSGPVEIIAAAPRSLVDRPLRAALGPLLVSLALIAIGLASATWVQLRYGLRPLRAFGRAVGQVRTGAAARLPDDQPRELQPIAQEVNALIAQNEAGLDHARRHLANLAHGLKTPLATLSLQLARDDADPASRALVEQLDQRIAHHLRRARSAGVSAGGRAHSIVADAIGDLINALRRIHADKALAFEEQVPPDLDVQVERQDLEEMLGNLLDNACRHARGHVRIAARAAGPTAIIEIEDDGAGMTDAEKAQALRPGERLDESGIGYGFGLTIAHELAELYGGALELGASAELGGLAARLTLPAVRAG